MRPVSINDAEPAASRSVNTNTVRPYLGYGSINQRESTGSSQYHSLQVTLNRRMWFNTAAFARPASGTFGNMRRNSLRGPGLRKVDVALFKNFRPHPRLRAQFRAEAFNAFHTPIFTSVGRTLTTTATGVNPALGNFGVVTGTADARVLQLALKVTF